MATIKKRMGSKRVLALALGVLAFFLLIAGASAQTRKRAAALRLRQQNKATPQKSSTTTTQPASPSSTPLKTTTPQATPTPAPKSSPTPKPVAEDEDVEVVRVTSNLVVVPVSVTDNAGQPVLGLKPADFRLEEEGHAEEIAQIGDPEQVPLNIAIIFDASSSVTAKNFFSFQQQAAVRFLKQVMKPIDKAAIFIINDTPRLEQPLAPADVVSAKLLAIPAANVPTPTAFYDTVTTAAKYLAKNAPERNRRVIVALTDGDDNFSSQIRDETVEEARAEARGVVVPAESRKRLQERHRKALIAVQRDVQLADAVFYSINPGGPSVHLNDISTRAQNGMQQLADATGGTAFVPDKAEALETVFRQITNELRSQYLLQYYSDDTSTSGKYLRIKVSTPTQPALRIRARQGYYAKRK